MSLGVGLDDDVNDVLAVAHWIGARSALIGHGLGGMVVQTAAEVLDPLALVLVASVGPGHLGRHDDDFLDSERRMGEHLPVRRAPRGLARLGAAVGPADEGRVG